MKVAFIVNPKAGRARIRVPSMERWSLEKILNAYMPKGKTKFIVRYVEQRFRKEGHTIETIFTKGNGDAHDIARDCVKKKYSLIIVGGGDGTLNEVVNGLNGKSIPIGVLPLGTANSVAEYLGMPFNIKKACSVLLKRNIIKMDTGIVNDRHFIMCAGMGFDARAIQRIDKKMKINVGSWAYVWAGVKTYLFDKSYRFSVDIDGTKIERDALGVIVGNIPNYGGDIKMVPHADPTDGKLDVAILNNRGMFAIWRYYVKAWFGKTAKHMEHYQGKKITINARPRVPYHTDAELQAKTPVKITVKPNWLRMIYK